MNREKELEKILTALFTLAPNVRQKDWDKAHEMYCNLSTIAQQSLSGSEQSSTTKLCDSCYNRKLNACSTCKHRDPANISDWYKQIT